ncbi:hypothetical protein OIU84_021345 [Salix udensis]|uniref:Rubisco LSMT substrate-binding domain-containing protein n=1 Tax=Salix udensis TaxID=889485 RepID=A0AAD6PIW3_9ROSI|nr:hypothetical protein OIU84_021345 [Salix udensis]
MAVSKIVMASLANCRPLTCAATATASSYQERLVSHPPDLIKWTKTELMRAHSVLVNLAQKVPDELWAMKLGLKLLQERARVSSFWWPYISNLPQTYSVPIFFQGEDIKNLQYAPLVYQVNRRCRFLLDFEQEVKRALENLKQNDHPFDRQDVDASSLGWSMSAVSSRAFRLHGKKLPDGTRIDAPMMLPLIDMCNHAFNPNAQIIQEQDAGSAKMLIKVVAETPIKQNDAILLNYGCLNNDLFPIGLWISPWQQQFLSQLNLVGEAANLKVTLGGQDLVDGRLLAALRVLLAGDMEMVRKHDMDTLKSLSADAPLGIANEVSAYRTIIALCVIALEHFPTKIMEDESSLKQGVSASTELAIQFRIQKKSVIIDVMSDLTRRAKSLLSKNTTACQG